jgi:hypothetical protein
MTDDPTIQRIESFRCRRGQLLAERRKCGYTLSCQFRRACRTLWLRHACMERGARSRYGGMDAASGPGVDGLYSARDLIS